MRKGYLWIAFTLVLLLVNSVAFAAQGDKLIKVGMRGDDVQIIQRMLSDAGFFNGDIDGIFGTATLRAVKEFQRSNGLVVDGTVGRETYMYLERSSSEPGRYSRALNVIASAYTSNDDGNSNYTCRGNLVRKGLVAVDPAVIPLGTRLYIPGYGYAIADDIGGAIKGNSIDLAFDSRSDALQFGVQRITIYVMD
ncbi:MAG: peptidoglycan-binding protein [Veillonellales bacterium]